MMFGVVAAERAQQRVHRQEIKEASRRADFMDAILPKQGAKCERAVPGVKMEFRWELWQEIGGGTFENSRLIFEVRNPPIHRYRISLFWLIPFLSRLGTVKLKTKARVPISPGYLPRTDFGTRLPFDLPACRRSRKCPMSRDHPQH